MKLLKKVPFFLLLLLLFFCLHGSVQNYGYIDLQEVLVIGFLSLAGMAALYLILFLFTRDHRFASLLCFFIATWYLFFGAIHDWITGTGYLFFLRKYIVLLPVLLALTIAWIIFLKRKKKLYPRLFLYLNVLLLIYCGIDAVQLVQKYFSARNTKFYTMTGLDTAIPTAKPNLYFLLFDAYPGYKSLQDSFGFANDRFYASLQQKGFKILPSFSNYDFTVFSMSSILNMRYIDSNYDPAKLTQHDIQLRINEIRNAAVFTLFEKMGYAIVNYSIFDIGKQHSIDDQNSFLPVHSRMLTDKILHNRVIRTSGRLLQSGKFALPFLKQKKMYSHDINNKYVEKMVLQELAGEKATPQFCYAHFMMPHPPFYRDSTGKANPPAYIDEKYNGSKTLLTAYLEYTNTVIENLVTKIITHDPKAIIVLLSDHGSRFYDDQKQHNLFNHDNFSAVYLPGKNYLPVPDTLSTVNLFRYLFNSAFGQDMPYLPDRIVVVKE